MLSTQERSWRLSAAQGSSVERTIRSGGQPLDRQTAAFYTSRLGFDFTQVRIHTDHAAAESAGQLGALAYSAGNDLVFGAGRFRPTAPEGRRLLSHELAHVVQRFPSSEAALQGDTFALDNARAEVDADRAADSVGAGKATTIAVRTGPHSVALKADPAHVATLDVNAIRADPDYIENGLEKIEFLEAQQAILHYTDGASLTLGLVPPWIKAPVVSVDYRSTRGEYAEVAGPQLRFIPRPGELPAKGMSYGEVIRRFAVTATFTVVDGKIVPSHINPVTAPRLCEILREAEAQYVKNFDAMAKGMTKVLEKMRVIVMLEMMRVSLGGPRTAPPRALGAGTTGSVLTRAGTVTLEQAVERGLLPAGGRLAQILAAIQRLFVAEAPASMEQGLSLVARAAQSVGMEAGTVSGGGLGADFIELSNVGGVLTRILSTGEIIVSRAGVVLLRLLP